MDRIAVATVLVPRAFSLQRAALLRVLLAAQRVPVGTIAVTQIVGKSGEKLASSKHSVR
jgi:hypothetical protein